MTALPATASPAPFRVRVFAPPYERLGPALDPADLAPRCVEDGSVICIDPLSLDLAQWARWCGRLRRTIPQANLVLLDRGAPKLGPILGTRAGLLGVQAVLPPDGCTVAALRESLTAPGLLEWEIRSWLRLVVPALPESTADMAVDLFRLGFETRARIDVDEALPVTGRAARYALGAGRLPPPGRWLRLGRTLPVLLACQRHPSTDLRIVAREAAMELRALRNQSRSLFGATPLAARNRLGWTWLLARFLQKRK